MHHLDISRPLFPQFGQLLDVPASARGLEFDNALGYGTIERHAPPTPGGIALLHFRYRMARRFPLRSFNPVGSDYFLLNVNLSDAPVRKQVGGHEVQFHRHTPSAVLFYPAGTEVTTAAPPDMDFEVALLRLPTEFLTAAYPALAERLASASATPLYEDLDATSERLLRDALAQKDGLLAHARVLEFTSRVFTKVANRKAGGLNGSLHPTDVAGIFLAAARPTGGSGPHGG